MLKPILSLTTVLTPLLAQAEISTPDFFSDGMVLQQKTGAKIWGSANPNSTVTIDFAGKTSSAKSDASGKWSINLENLAASKQPHTLTITNGSDTKKIENVLVGEVWLASGQSNMEWTMARTNGAAEAKTANDPHLRIYVSNNVAAPEPQTNFKGTWKPTAPANTPRFTAVGYHFAKKLRAELDVPVGIIECSWGGKPVQAFTSRQALAKTPEAKAMMQQFDKRLEQHAELTAKGKKAQHPGTRPNNPTTLYNGMIAPLVGYGIRGAIWYQGESNANQNTAANYAELQAAMINDWRQRWGHDFPFYYVQLANFAKWRSPAHWMIVQDEQRQMLDTIKNTGMAVTSDIGDPNDIHPKNKKDVGQRLARWALRNQYGQNDLVPSGPLYAGHEIKDGKIQITFNHADGLKSKNNEPLATFQIQDSDNTWHPAKATIQNNTITLHSPQVKNPKAARYAWSLNPTKANLTNATNLPASTFTTP